MKKLFMFLAVAGIFVSCKPEEIETAYEVGAAVATINVVVVDVNAPEETVSPSDYTLVTSQGEYSNGVVTITGNKTIPAGDVTLTVTYQEETYTQTVTIPHRVLAGGVYEVTERFVVGTVVVPPTPDPVEITVEVTGPEMLDPSYYYFTPNETGHGHGHGVDPEYTHDYDGRTITNWCYNSTSIHFVNYADYTNYSGSTVVAWTYDNEEYKSVVDSYMAAYPDTYAETPARFEFTVLAWSYYTVEQIKDIASTKVTVLADGVQVGSFEVWTYSTTIHSISIANPYGHGHYGHGSFGDVNAGGGIVDSE